MPQWIVFCEKCRRMVEIWERRWGPLYLDWYEGQDLIEAESLLYCTLPLMESLTVLPGLEFRQVETSEHLLIKSDIVISMDRFWGIENQHILMGADLLRVQDMSRPPCPECGMHPFIDLPDKVLYEGREWETWRVDFSEWNGESFLWIAEPSGYLRGPIFTEAFMEIASRFNLGADVKIHKVEWDEE